MKPVWRKTIAVFEAVGGVCGSVTVAPQLVRSRHPAADLGLLVVLLAIYLLALYAGVMLWRDTRRGRVASVVAQFIQLPKLLSPQLAFMVSYGLDFAPMAVASPGPAGYGLVFDVRLASHQLLLVNAGWLPDGFGLSVVSLLSLRLLLRPVASASSEPDQHTLSAPVPSEHPEWVMPFWLKAVGILVLALTILCTGLCLLPGQR